MKIKADKATIALDQKEITTLMNAMHILISVLKKTTKIYLDNQKYTASDIENAICIINVIADNPKFEADLDF